jgi:hypothetical protein
VILSGGLVGGIGGPRWKRRAAEYRTIVGERRSEHLSPERLPPHFPCYIGRCDAFGMSLRSYGLTSRTSQVPWTSNR